MKINYMTPVVTIFNKKGKIDRAGNKEVYEHLINNGVDGIVILGSSGEFFSMSVDEKKALIKLAGETIANRTRFIVGSSSMDPKECIEISDYAVDSGAEAVMVIPPYYFALNDESIMEYFDIVATGTKANILLYNFPDRNGYDISPSLTLKMIRKHKNIVGYKDTVSGMNHTRALIQAIRPEFPEFEILSGYDDNFVHNILSGGNGNIGSLSNFVPEITSALCRAVREKDMDNVILYQQKIDQLMCMYDISSPFMPAFKKAMMLRGLKIEDYSTAPFMRVTDEQTEKIKSVMNECGIGKY